MSNKAVGNRLKELRKASGLTQERFAYQIGYSVHMLRKIESGERAISSEALQLVAKTLNKDIDELIELGSPILQPVQTPPPQPDLPPQYPAWTTPFIGRDQELAELTALFKSPECRLVTLFGPGGVGKTRLSVACAQQRSERVYFVSLESISPETFSPLLSAIVSAFQFSLPQHEELLAPIVTHLQQRPTLLVLDNFEHLVSQSTAMLTTLLAQVNTLKVLVTSRQPLNAQSETVYPISGLPSDASRQLFISRMQKHWLGTEIEADATSIEQICQWMEGIPLGIELAATWSRTIPCTQILASLEKGEIDWAVPSEDIPDRHRNLQQIWAFAWEQLRSEEQAFLLKCSIFEDGFTYDAVTEVSEVPLELLFKLHDQGWLQRWENERYRIHPLPLAFLRNTTWSTSEATLAYQRHADYYAAFIASHITQLRDNSAAEVKTYLMSEMANFERAWCWYIQTKNVQVLSAFISDLFFLYRTTWQLPVFIQKLAESISLTKDQAIVGEWQRLLAESYFRIGKLKTSIDYYRQTLETLQVPYPGATTPALIKPIGRYIRHRVRPSRATAIAPGISSITPSITRSAALTYEKLGLIFYLTAQDQYIASSCLQCYNYAVQCGDDEAIAHASMNLSFAWAMLGQDKQARHHINQALEAAVRCNNPRIDADMAGGQMVYYGSIGEWEIAQKLGEGACKIYQDLELWREYGEAALTLVMTSFLRQDYQTCIQWADQLIRYHQYNESDHFFLSLLGQAYCYIRLQEWSHVDEKVQKIQRLIAKVQPVGITAQFYHTVMGLWSVHTQAYEKALLNAQTIQALLQRGSRTFTIQPCFTGAIQICLHILEQDKPTILARQAKELSQTLFTDFDKYCRRYPSAKKSYQELRDQWAIVNQQQSPVLTGSE